MIGDGKFDKQPASILSCAEVYHVLANSCEEGSFIVEIRNVFLTQVSDPLEKILCKRSGAEPEEQLLIKMILGDASGGIDTAAFSKAAFAVYNIAAGITLDESSLKNKIDQMESYVFSSVRYSPKARQLHSETG